MSYKYQMAGVHLCEENMRGKSSEEAFHNTRSSEGGRDSGGMQRKGQQKDRCRGGEECRPTHEVIMPLRLSDKQCNAATC